MKTCLAALLTAALLPCVVNSAEPDATALVVRSGQSFNVYRQGQTPDRVSAQGGSDTMRVSGGGTVKAQPADRDAASWAAAAFPDEKLRLAPRPGGGWQLFSQGGQTGSIVPSATGYTIYFAGKTRSIMRSASGWTVYRAR